MTTGMTKYQRSIDSYIASRTKFEDLCDEDLIVLIIEYLDEAHDKLSIRIPAHELAAFFDTWLKDDGDETAEFIQRLKRCFLDDAAKSMHNIKLDLQILGRNATAKACILNKGAI